MTEKSLSIKISTDKPPVWENARAVFRFNPKTTVFAYGDTIYNPGAVNLPPDILAHEMVHIGQQKNSRKEAELWWGKYLRDPEFRVSQEVEAYGKQLWFICQDKKINKQIQFNVLKRFAEILSGPMYAECVSFYKALELIKEEAKKHDTPIH